MMKTASRTIRPQTHLRESSGLVVTVVNKEAKSSTATEKNSSVPSRDSKTPPLPDRLTGEIIVRLTSWKMENEISVSSIAIGS